MMGMKNVSKKKVLGVLLSLAMILSLAACGSKKKKEKKEEGFKPSLDTSSESHIKIAGGYDNFEAL